MRWPGTIPPGKTCSEIATTLDILPTVAAMVGAKLPTDRTIDGKNILPLMQASPGAKTPHESYVLLYRDGCVRSGKWKYYPFNAAAVAKAGLSKDDPRSKATVQLYDLSSDPYEKHNLAERHPEVIARLHKAYTDLKTDIRKNARPRGE
jgi:arylsulfatase A